MGSRGGVGLGVVESKGSGLQGGGEGLGWWSLKYGRSLGVKGVYCSGSQGGGWGS